LAAIQGDVFNEMEDAHGKSEHAQLTAALVNGAAGLRAVSRVEVVQDPALALLRHHLLTEVLHALL